MCYHLMVRALGKSIRSPGAVSAALWVAATSAAACGPAQGSAAIETPSVTPPAIEVSGEGDGSGGRQAAPIGEGDEHAQRCFAAARAQEGMPQDVARWCAAGGPAACEAACREGGLTACSELAYSLAAELGDTACATKLWQLTCDRDGLSACLRLAAQLITIGASPATVAQAQTLLEKSCEGGWAAGCIALGRFHLPGGAGRADGDLAVKALEKGCDQGNAESCALASTQLSSSGKRADRERAVRRQEQACGLGHARSCVAFATALTLGIVVPRDPQRATQILGQLCQLDGVDDEGAACAQLAMQQQAANGGHSSPQVEALLARACDQGNLSTCSQVAATHYNAGRFSEAAALTSKLVTKLPDDWLTRFAGGMSLFNLGRFDEAEPQLVELCRLRADWVHCQLWLYAARERGGRDGKAGLRKALPGLDRNHWPVPVLHFFLGKLSAPRLLAEAKHHDRPIELERLCEANYYIGQQHMIRGRKRQAAKLFKRAVDTGISNFVEYTGAKAELATLQPKP